MLLGLCPLLNYLKGLNKSKHVWVISVVTVIELTGQSDLKYKVYFGSEVICIVPHGREALAIENQVAACIAARAEWDQC